MKDFILITGNQNKADYLAKWLGQPVVHRKIELDEIQSLDLEEVVSRKAHQAFEIAGRPVLVEDVALTFLAIGRLPGTFVKWFLEELGIEGMCRLVKGLTSQDAVASMIYGLYDGKDLRLFEGSVSGTISEKPRGDSWGYNGIFIPKGSDKTYAEMSDEEFNFHSHRGLALQKLKAFLDESVDSNI